ncbi:MAG: hypothetical protein Q9164_001881, partial [Protoblastenia rupestris]
MTTPLQTQWTALYKNTLPTLARSKNPSQPCWPIQLDHCFARIILDAVIGRSEKYDSSSSSLIPASTKQKEDPTPAPWTAHLKSPAVKHMSSEQLEQCITLGEAIADGKVNLEELDERSLAARGKASKTTKRKRDGNEGTSGATPSSPLNKTSKIASTPESKSTASPQKSGRQIDIRTALGAAPLTPPHSPPAPVEPDLETLIQASSDLTPFRKRVLLALCQ